MPALSDLPCACPDAQVSEPMCLERSAIAFRAEAEGRVRVAAGGGVRWWGGMVAMVMVGLAVLTGCTTPGSGAKVVSDSGLPRNVFCEAGRMPDDLKRVAVLPLGVMGEDAVLESGREALYPILQSELMRAARFEVIPVSPEQCRQWTGRTGWSASETLPRDFFERLRQGTGCDAVLFSQLTRYRPYPPVAVGWRLQLVMDDPIRAWWAVDEVFDGGDPVVAEAARAYYKVHFAPPAGSDPDSILSTPRRFGQFTLTAVTESLPPR